MRAPRTRVCRRWHLYATVALVAIGRFSDPACAATSPPLPTRPFRARDWNLAWQAFVGAGRVNDAYALTQIAVKARPNSRRWLARLADSARWSNHPRTALAALCRLALRLHEARYLQPALNLALGLGEDAQAVAVLRELISLGRATAAQRQMLSGLYLDIGEPEQAIGQLQREFRHTPEPRLLWEQAVIYRTIGDPARELATLQRYRRHFGPGPKVMLAIATLQYVQGHLAAALNTLLSAERGARPTDTAYWQTLSGLAWELGRYRLAADAATVLIGSARADAALYLRVVYAQQYDHPRRAFEVAVRGWQQTHDRALFVSLLGIASSLHPAKPWLARAFALLKPHQAASFADTPLYWTSLAELRFAQGHDRAALAAYGHALRESPGDNNLLADYLWLLIDKGELAPLAPRLYRLDRQARNVPQLWAPLAAAYTALHQPARALPWLQAQWPTRKNDPAWLVDYADTLAQADHLHAAWLLRRRAYRLLADSLSPALPPEQRERRRIAIAGLTIALAPGDPARAVLERLAQRPDRRQARLLALTAMQGEHADSLARWWLQRTARQHSPPTWALLAQALSEYDGAAVAALLERDRSGPPRRDQVDAARVLGWNSLALTLAYQALEHHPGDSRLQHQFATMALSRADSFGAVSGATETSGLLEEGIELQADQRLAPDERVSVRLATFHQRSIDRTQLGTPPSLNRSVVLGWRHTADFGRLSFALGAGRNLSNWVRAGVSWRKRWDDTLQTTLGAMRGARPLDTAALSVAGLEDHIVAGASAQLSARTSAQLQLQAGQLRAQGGGSLGTVQRFALAADYQLWFAPPDFGLSASVSGAHYSHAAYLPAQLRPLVPADQTPDVGFFVPESFLQACAGGHFNMRYKRTFTSQLRPFASADLCANSVSGQGYDLTAGVAMPVLGADHLSLSLNLENNVGTHSGRTAGVMLRYRHYFNSMH